MCECVVVICSVMLLQRIAHSLCVCVDYLLTTDVVSDVERDNEMHYPEPNEFIGKCSLFT